MQVLHRTGEDRDKRPASGAGSTALEHIDPEENMFVDEALQIRASHITAAAVAAAAVTAAVVTAGASAESADAAAVASRALSTGLDHPELPSSAFPQTQVAAQATLADKPVQAAPSTVRASARGALVVSLLTLIGMGAVAWWSTQWQWPQRALQPIVSQLPSANPGATPLAMPVATEDQADSAVRSSVLSDQIAALQQEAEAKAHLLAQKRAAAEARHRREDAALALREQRRRQAEAQLAAARAKAERAQTGVVEMPEIVEVPAAPSLAEQVKQCGTLSLFARERCLWQLCNGKWGEAGCPSYERNNEGA